jgi:hypothetical protein
MDIGLLGMGILVSVLLMLLFWVPFLRKEIRDGKGELGPIRRLTRRGVQPGPVAPTGAGDNNPGRVGDPAPGEPSGQPDPWSERAR